MTTYHHCNRCFWTGQQCSSLHLLIVMAALQQTLHNQLICRTFIISSYPAPPTKKKLLHLQCQVLETQKEDQNIYKVHHFLHPLCNSTFSTGLEYLLKTWNLIKPSYLFILLTAAVGEEDLFLLLF